MEDSQKTDQINLSPEEIRVLASLIEKSLATPQQYPLTLNALVLSCNQSTNRDPIVSYTDELVEKVLQILKEKELVRFIYPSHGRSATRYRHVVNEKYGLGNPELALAAVLMLRGPQTAGELRARTDRLYRFDSISDTEGTLEMMSDIPHQIVRRLPRRPGTKEERWAFYGNDSGATNMTYVTGSAGISMISGEPGTAEIEDRTDTGSGAGTENQHAKERTSALLEQLIAQVSSLRHDLDEVRSSLGLI
jgi:hypothetical protein